MQHLISEYREGDVAYDVPEEDLLHRQTDGADVGSLAERRHIDDSQRAGNDGRSWTLADPAEAGFPVVFP